MSLPPLNKTRHERPTVPKEKFDIISSISG